MKKTESELVHEYAKKVMRGKQSRGHVDERFQFTKGERTVNKELWLDSDFYFAVVFQSSRQKEEFFKKMKLVPDEDLGMQIVNGLKLAERLGVTLTKEIAEKPPTINLDLLPFILDDETIP